ncbi:hypothetical protein [Paenarthrobacter sp. YJN-5]|nr:hypothetical protein [Paenarthrobacter sp. YJN-5]
MAEAGSSGKSLLDEGTLLTAIREDRAKGVTSVAAAAFMEGAGGA